MKRHPALLTYGTMTDTMSTVRDLPTTRDRLLYLAESAGHWRRYARMAETGANVGLTEADVDRWTAYAVYLESIGRRIMRYTLARHGIRPDAVPRVLTPRRILDLDL